MDIPHFVLKRQEASLNFSTFYLKTIVVLSSGSIIALLALISPEMLKAYPGLVTNIKCVIPFFLVSSFHSLMAVLAAHLCERAGWSLGYYEKEIEKFEVGSDQHLVRLNVISSLSKDEDDYEKIAYYTAFSATAFFFITAFTFAYLF